MITCHLASAIEPAPIEACERFARRGITLVHRYGGTHHGDVLPSEGASDVADAALSFPSLAADEESACVRRRERTVPPRGRTASPRRVRPGRSRRAP